MSRFKLEVKNLIDLNPEPKENTRLLVAFYRLEHGQHTGSLTKVFVTSLATFVIANNMFWSKNAENSCRSHPIEESIYPLPSDLFLDRPDSCTRICYLASGMPMIALIWKPCSIEIALQPRQIQISLGGNLACTRITSISTE